MAYFRIVDDNNSVDITDELSLYSIGGISKDAWIVFENDACVITEEEAGSNEITILAKEKDGLFDYSFVKDVCDDIKALRKQLDYMFSMRRDTWEMLVDCEKYWSKRHNHE